MFESSIPRWMKVQLEPSEYETTIVPCVSQISSLHKVEGSSTLETVQASVINISNPNYAYDTTLMPYLETMYEEIPRIYRRSSVSEKIREREKARKREHAIPAASKFLKRLSRANISNTKEDDGEGTGVYFILHVLFLIGSCYSAREHFQWFRVCVLRENQSFWLEAILTNNASYNDNRFL